MAFLVVAIALNTAYVPRASVVIVALGGIVIPTPSTTALSLTPTSTTLLLTFTSLTDGSKAFLAYTS